MTASILNIEQISLAFGGVKALTDVSFSVKKGSVFSIIGPNGQCSIILWLDVIIY